MKKISAKSILEKEFVSYLKNKNIKIISFDIFETLAFRKVKYGTDLFKQIAKKSFVRNIFFTKHNFVSARVAAEKRARELNSKNEDITLELIYNQLPLNKKQKKKIISLELQIEYKNLYINFQIQRWIQLAHKYNKKIILISDTYFSFKELQHLVFSKLKNKSLISDIYISNIHQLTKATGNLYLKVLDDLNIKAHELLHVGDNNYSDIQMAKQKNISTIHYSCDTDLKKVFNLESSYIKSLNKNHNYRIQTSLLNIYKAKEERDFFNLGAVIFGPILWEFSHWINTLAKQNNISQINCVMREGKIFERYISKVTNNLDTKLIYASRKSTFLPSINIEEIQNNSFNFYTYRELSVQGFYNLFRLKIKNKIIKEIAHTLLKDQIDTLNIISKDIKNRLDEIKINILNEKKYFKKYMKQQNYQNKSITIDFGGTGSILKNIENILHTDKKKHLNVLFYAHAGSSQKMQHSKLISFLPLNNKTNKEIELIRRNHEFLEILFNGFNNTTLHYKKCKNSIKAITSSNNKSIKRNREKLLAFEKGIDSFFKIAKHYKLKNKLYSKEELLLMISRLIEVPTIDESLAIGSLYRDENYTNTKPIKLISKENLKSINKFGVQESYYQNSLSPNFKINNIPWVQGVITQLDDTYLQNIKSLATKGVNSDSISKILELLEQDKTIKEIYVYGAGELFKELLPHLQQREINIKSLLDSRAKVSTFSFNGFKVYDIADVKLTDGDCIVVASAVFAVEITKTIIQSSKNKKLKIINFYNDIFEIN